MQDNQQQLNEGLRSGDLRNYISDLFTVDQYKSKMGEDQDVLVLSFKVKEKYPAIDLMEFIEKGYDFILDADMSSGEEHDGQYQVFVEIERTPKLSEQLTELLGGISQLCDSANWRFRYQSAKSSVEFNEDTVNQHIPMTSEEYSNSMMAIKENDLKDFFDQGAVSLELQENNKLIFKRPYAGNIEAKFIAIGEYENVKKTLPGKLSLDESSQSQVLFLTKFLGNYDIDKIDNKFLIRNGNNAVIIEKNRW